VHLSLKRPGWLVLASQEYIAPGRLFWILQSIGWGALAAAAFVREVTVTGVWNSFVNTCVLVASGIPVTLLWHTTLRYGRKKHKRPMFLIVAGCCGAIAGGFLWWAINVFLLDAVGTVLPISRSWTLEMSGTLDAIGIRAGLIFVWGILYLAIKDWIELQLAGERMARAELATQTIRLRSLQSQLQPHFIFNSLNAISTLVGDGRTTEARSAISLLGDFLRRTMQTRDTPEITVADELEFVRLYLDLVELRFGDRLRSRIDVDPSALSLSIPCLLLQPLVENAVRHGLLPRNSVGTIDINISATDSTLFLTVEDDGIGLQKKTASPAGIGLSNTATRLSDLYGMSAKFTVGPSASGGVRVAIQLPRRQRPAVEQSRPIAMEQAS
jgi:two-component system, LytTR family, sensor kinase